MRSSVSEGAPQLTILSLTRADGSTHESSSERWKELLFETGDRICLSCAAQVVPRLRRVKGLRAAPEDASEALGKKRRHRCLHEAVLAAGSPLVGLDVDAAASHPMLDHTALWGLRRSRTAVHKARASLSTIGSLTLSPGLAGALLSADSAIANANSPAAHGGGGVSGSANSEALRAGDTLLIEADEGFSDAHDSDPAYALLSIVPASMPPRESTPKDLMRLCAALGCLVALLALSATRTVALLPLALLLAFFLVAIKSLTLDQAWRAINYRVLLTICCSFGLGSALSNTGVSDIIASGLGPIGEHGGAFVFLIAVFFLTSILSCIVSNSATVVLLYHCLRLVHVKDLHPAQPLLALMLGASCAFATPIGYQTNLMVLARGGYRFGDYTLLGGLLTIVVGLTACAVIYEDSPHPTPTPPG